MALALLVAATPVPPSGRLTVLVRIDTHALERYVRVSDLTREIRALWAPYAEIDVTDINKPAERGYHDQLRLVVVERQQSNTSEEPLAWITFTAPGQPEDLITVSIGGARTLMAEARWGDRRIADLTRFHQRQFMTRALARSAAHEIGHYLLRSSAHSRAGLMRERLTAADVMDNDLRVFRLEPAQIEAMRRRIARAPMGSDLDLCARRKEQDLTPLS